MKIFAAHDGGSGCAFYRMEVPLRELDRHDGFDVTFADAGDTHHPPSITARDLEGFDVIVGQRLNKHDGMSVWRRARTPTSRLVYELDDDIWTIGPQNWQAYNLFGREDIRDAIEHSAQIADLITVTTPYLASVMTERTGNPATAVLPNCVPGWVLDLPYVPRQRPAVGWVGGASHGTDIGLIASVMRRFCDRFPDWDLQLGGTDYRPTFRLGDRALYTNWIQVNQEPEHYYESFDFDIGLAPLTDDAFSRAKSPIKAIEYNSRGIPVIASDVEPYRGYVRDGENGFLIRYDHDWLKRLSELASDEKLRARMSAASREAAREYTIERGWKWWADAYTAMFPPRK
jgi:glycosyltransferase involved in cell wall biosynthesis